MSLDEIVRNREELIKLLTCRGHNTPRASVGSLTDAQVLAQLKNAGRR